MPTPTSPSSPVPEKDKKIPSLVISLKKETLILLKERNRNRNSMIEVLLFTTVWEKMLFSQALSNLQKKKITTVVAVAKEGMLSLI